MQLELIANSPANRQSRHNILFIHGAYHGAWCWAEHFLDYFANAGYAAYALSLRGHGHSESIDLKTVSFHDYLEDIDQTIQTLGESTILVGHSMGGMLVHKYIETHALPAAVIMSTATPQGLNAVGATLLRLYPLKTIQMLLTGNPDILWHSSPAIQNLFLSDDIPPEKQQDYRQRIISQSESKQVMLKELPSLKFNPPSQPQPVLIVKGKNDALITDSACQKLADLHQVQPILLDQLPHDLMLGANWRLAADTVLSWLQAERVV